MLLHSIAIKIHTQLGTCDVTDDELEKMCSEIEVILDKCLEAAQNAITEIYPDVTIKIQ